MSGSSDGERWREAALAALYDWEHDSFEDDAQLYLELSKRTGGPALEIACGTGRVLEPLAKAGLDVVGIDHSAAMLARARKRLCDAGTRARLIEVDMTEDLPVGSFGIAILALNAFGFALEPRAQVTLLKRIADRLDPHGVLVVDLVNPAALTDPPSSTAVLQRSGRCAELDSDVSKWIVQEVSFANQTLDLNCIYDMADADGNLKRLTDRVHMRHFSRFEAEMLFDAAGLEVEGVHGDYELGDLHDGASRMIFIAGRR